MTTVVEKPQLKAKKPKYIYEYRVNSSIHVQDELRPALDENKEPILDDDGNPVEKLEHITYPTGSLVRTTRQLDKLFNVEGYPPKYTRTDNIREITGPESFSSGAANINNLVPAPPTPTDTRKVADLVETTRKVAGAVTESTTKAKPNDTISFMTTKELTKYAEEEEINIDGCKDDNAIRAKIYAHLGITPPTPDKKK